MGYEDLVGRLQAYYIRVQGAGVWGQITGDINTQTDLVSLFSARVPVTREITINGVTQDLSSDRSWTINVDMSAYLTIVNAASTYLPLAGGTLTGNLLFTDNTYDIGASGATRPRTGYFGTSIFSPTIIGGTGTTSTLTYKPTTGVGTTGADHVFLTGNNGATEALRILNSGNSRFGVITGTGQGLLVTVSGSAYAAGLYSYRNGGVSWSITEEASLNLMHPSGAPIITGNGTLWIRGNTSSGIVSFTGNQRVIYNTAPTTSANYGLVSLGSAPFDGVTSGFFTGSANGTVIATNLAAGYQGAFYNYQVAGVDKIKSFINDASGGVGLSLLGTVSGSSLGDAVINLGITGSTSLIQLRTSQGSGTDFTYLRLTNAYLTSRNNRVSLNTDGSQSVSPFFFTVKGIQLIPIAPVASANYGVLSLGSGAFDGGTAGFFTGSASGTVLAINAASGFAGDLVKYQVAGVTRFTITGAGNVGVGTSTPAHKFVVSGSSSTTASVSVTGGDAQMNVDRNTTGAGCYFGFSTNNIGSPTWQIGMGAGSTDFWIGNNNFAAKYITITTAGTVIGGTSINASAIFQIDSTTKGFAPPRMTGAQVEAIGTPLESLLAYATNAGAGTVKVKGWWGYDGANLVKIKTGVEEIMVAISDETTALTTGVGKITFRMPHAMKLTGVRASLATAQTSGSIFTLDINDSGATILSTKLTIDNTEKTSTTATTAAVISDVDLADDAEITIDIDQVGDGTAKGCKVTLIGYRV